MANKWGYKTLPDELQMIMKNKKEVPHLTQDTESLNHVSNIEINSLTKFTFHMFNEPSVVIHTVKGFGKIKCAHDDCGAIVHITLNIVSNTIDRMSATHYLPRTG